jgi:hypothetical protein
VKRGRRIVILVAGILVAAILIVVLVPPIRARAYRVVRPKGDVTARVAEYGPAARERMRPAFERAGVSYPPARVILVGLKKEKQLQVYAASEGGAIKFTWACPILAASGGPGPKLREGDNQVPEGMYKIESLNPNSLYHLALRVGYPSADDRARAAEDGRTHLGGDIMIHGSAASIGCLAMGDPMAEELFVLAADVGSERIELILSPIDFRAGESISTEGMPAWVAGRYAEIRSRLLTLPAP